MGPCWQGRFLIEFRVVVFKLELVPGKYIPGIHPSTHPVDDQEEEEEM